MPRKLSDESDLSDVSSDELQDQIDSSEVENNPSSENEPFNADMDDIDVPEEDEEDEEESSTPSNTYNIKRESRKRKVTYYEPEDEDEDEDMDGYHNQSVKRNATKKNNDLTGIDEDLILTDEETEYQGAKDPANMTERQRSRYSKQQEFLSLDALESRMNKKLPNKKVETENEAALRKSETNRRRQDYKNKLLEEEKRDTINKLLKRRATKTKSSEVQEDDEDDQTKSALKPIRPQLKHKALYRWVNSKSSTVLAIPQ